MQREESLSAYMDGYDTVDNFTEELCHSEELQKKWERYHTIRSIMHGDEVLLGKDFSLTLAQMIESENIAFSASDSNKRKGVILKFKRWSLPLMQVGIAASVCLITIFTVSNLGTRTQVAQSEPMIQTLPFSNAIQHVSYNAPAQDQPTPEELEYQQQRINELLQHHELQRRTNADGIQLNKNK